MQIVFLCGGLGKRLRSISENLPKSMVRISDKPFIYYLLKSIEKFNFESIHFCLGYGSESFIEYITKHKTNCNISYKVETERNLLGTGGAIKYSLQFLEDDFIVQYGDTILDINYQSLLELHLESKKSMTMSLLSSELSNEIPNTYCEQLSTGKLKCIYNKSSPNPKSNFIDYGAIAFNRNVFVNEKRKVFDLSDIQHQLTNIDQAEYFFADTPYIEIGTPDSFRKAKEILK